MIGFGRKAVNFLSTLTEKMRPDKLPKEVALSVWRGASAVCFDVDSTVVTEEGIDVLAEHCGAGDAVAAWTLKAMDGTVSFQESLEARLKLIHPNQSDIEQLHKKHPLKLTKGIEELVKVLHDRSVDVYLVSGGFRQMINPIASILKIPSERVFANNLIFNDDGSYAGFDLNEPTARSGGKARVVEHLKRTHGYTSVAMVGDGATDMEARTCNGADVFIGFGGISVRQVVKDGADLFVTDLKQIIEPLEKQ